MFLHDRPSVSNQGLLRPGILAHSCVCMAVDMVSLANDSHGCDIWFLILQRAAASYQLI